MAKLNLEVAFGVRDVIEIPLSDLIERLRQWQGTPESLSRWVAYSTRRRRLKAEGMTELVEEIHCGATKTDEAVSRCEMAFYEAMIRGVFKANAALATFDGSSHEKLLTKFRSLDLARIDITDWFHRPEEELKKVHAAIEAAKIDSAGRNQDAGDKPNAPPLVPIDIIRHEGELDACEAGCGVDVQPYKVASFRCRSHQDIHELPVDELAKVLSKIIRIEGPIHREEVARRVTQLWGLSRTGKRIRDAIESALLAVQREQDILLDGDFYHTNHNGEVLIRDRSVVDNNTLRKPEMLPPIEIRKALAAITKVNLGVLHDEAVIEASRLFGFKTTTSQLRSVIEKELQVLLLNGTLEERNDRLYLRSDASVNV